MKRTQLKRKRTSDVSKKSSQLSITKYLNIPTSTPINRKIELNSPTVQRETISCQLIRSNLAHLLANDVEKAEINKESPNIDSIIEYSVKDIEKQSVRNNEIGRGSDSNTENQFSENNIEKQHLVDDEIVHNSKHWREKAKYWEKKAKSYKEQFDFTNKLLNSKLREIEIMKKGAESKPDCKNDTSRNLLFRKFDEIISQDAMYILRSVHPGKKHDRKFVKYSLNAIYEDRNEVFQERTLKGRTKQKLTPAKLNNIKKLFLERIDSENGDFESNQSRYESLNRYITNTLIELANEYKARMKKAASSGVSNLIDQPSFDQNQNSPISMVPQQMETVENPHIDMNQNIFYSTPVASFTLTPNGYLLNSGNFTL